MEEWRDNDIMVRTQIHLTDDQHRDLKGWAVRLGISLSEAVRRCVADRLASESARSNREALVRDALVVVGPYADPAGASTVARDHDEHLADSYRQ
jgi:hypothetical protein